MTSFASLAIVLVAGSAFAFFNGEKKVEKPVLATQVYYHVGNDYIPMGSPPSGKTCKPDDFYCRITITGNNLPGQFSEDDLPQSNGDYTVTFQDPNSSWK